MLLGIHGLERSPHRTVALEAAAKHNLPYTVALLHAALGLDVGQLVPHRGGGGVAKAEERHAGWLDVQGGERQGLLNLIQHTPATSMDTEVFKRQAEVRDVGWDLELEDQAGKKRGCENKLLRDWQHILPQLSDIGTQSMTSDLHKVLGQVDAYHTIIVLLLDHTPVVLVCGSDVRALQVRQLVLGPAEVLGPAGHEDGRSTKPEQAVGNLHGASLAVVDVLSDVLSADDNGISIMNLKAGNWQRRQRIFV